MKAKTRAVTASVTVLLCLAAAALAEDAAAPAIAPADAPAIAPAGEPIAGEGTSVAKLIAAIREASDVRTAANNYAKARAMDKDNPELYDAYMKKMLTFGYPKLALYPATELRRLQAKNGTAYGVIGYTDAKRNRYFTAFTSTMRGMELLPDDPGIQHNAGVLMAWYETLRVKPRLAADLKTMLTANSDKWAGKAKYAEAYNKCKTDFAARAARAEKLKGQIGPAEKAAREAARDKGEAVSRYRKYAREIDRMEKDLRLSENRLEDMERNRLGAKEQERRRYDTLIAEQKRKNRERERKMKSLRNERDEIRKRAVDKTERLEEAEKALAKAKAELAAEQRVTTKLSWLPPAVDGVITPEDPNPPKFAADTGSTSTSKPSSVTAPEVQLKMAKLLLQNNRKQKAMTTLKSIVEKHPDSEAAKEAAKLLEELKEDEPGGP